jgi:uncharacterized protein (DUF362 family)
MKRQPPISRRTFLKLTATAAAATALASCTPGVSPTQPAETTTSGETISPPPSPTVEVSSSETATSKPIQTETSPAETAESTPEATSSPSPAYLAVVHGQDPESITRAAIDALGGMKSFVRPGYDVIVKPNICTDYHPPEYASTTNPTVVATLVSMCLEAGAKRVRVMDYPFGGTAKSAYEISGIQAAVEAAGGEMHIMSRPKYIKADIPLGKSMNQVQVYPDILEADLLINVPIAKHHNASRLTLGCKNLMGTVLDRNLMHADLHQRIADVTSLVQPDLTVVDAVRILMNHGPTGGNLADVKQTNQVIASRDIVAADSYATTLFGLTAADIGYIVASAELGLGTTDLASIDLREINLG